MRLLTLLFATLLMPLPAHAQSSSGGSPSPSSSSPSSSSPSSSQSMGGSSGSAKTENAPSGTLRTGPDRDRAPLGGGSPTMGGGSATLGTPGGGTAPGSSGRRAGQEARVPDECDGPISDPRCPTASAPTGTGLGDRGTGGTTRRPYGPADSPVQGGPAFTGPTGRPLDLPDEGR